MAEQTQAPSKPDIGKIASQIMGLPQPEAPKPETTEAQSVESEQPEVETTDQALEVEGEQSEGEATGSEVEEVEFDGVRFTLPKGDVQKVKDAFMRHADYTQKTQEISERARTLSAQEQMFRAQAEFHQSTMEDISTIKAYEQAINQMGQVNWQTLSTDEALRTKIQADQLRDGLQRAKDQLNQKWSQFNQKRTETMKNLERAARSELAKRIQGFTEANERELKDYARARGYQDAAVEQLMLNPLDAEMIWKANQYDKLSAQKGTINQRANKAPPIVKPSAVQKQASEAGKLLASFKASKDKYQKEQLGREIFSRKIGLK